MDIKIEKNGKVQFEDGDIALVQGLDEIAQRLRIRFNVQKGEWVFDLEHGLPFDGVFLVKSPNESEIRAVIRERALGVPEVERIDNYTADVDTEDGSISVSFDAVVDEEVISVSFGVNTGGFWIQTLIEAGGTI